MKASSRASSVSALLALAAALVLLAVPASASGAIKLGVYSGANGQSTALEDPRVLDNYIAMVGRKPAIVLDYSNLTDPLLTPAKIDNVRSHGVVPMITWQLFKSGWGGETLSLREIADGRYDSHIRDAARLARGLPFPVMIRFAHEMNGDWYGWSGQPNAYVAAWRHVVSIFRAENARNVSWVWSPNVDNGDYPFTAYFPGDAWVDYVALDGYNWGRSGVGRNRWESLREVFASSYAQLTRMSSRPVIIAETASSEIGGNKAEWIREGFLSTIPARFPRVAAVIWFNRDMEQDWRVNSSSGSLNAFRQVAASSLYGGPVATTAPAASKQRNSKLRIKRLRVTRKVRGDGRIRFRLSSRATVKVAIERRVRRGKYVRALSAKREAAAGETRMRFSSIGKAKRLRSGAYRVRISAVDGSGARSPRLTARFRVL